MTSKCWGMGLTFCWAHTAGDWTSFLVYILHSHWVWCYPPNQKRPCQHFFVSLLMPTFCFPFSPLLVPHSFFSLWKWWATGVTSNFSWAGKDEQQICSLSALTYSDNCCIHFVHFFFFSFSSSAWIAHNIVFKDLHSAGWVLFRSSCTAYLIAHTSWSQSSALGSFVLYCFVLF